MAASINIEAAPSPEMWTEDELVRVLTDEDGNVITDEDGNPITVRVR